MKSATDANIIFQALLSMKAPLARFAYVIIFLVVVTYAFFAYPKGMHAWQDKQRQIQEMEKKNAVLAQEVERKKEHVGRLKNNPSDQELEIRKRLKLLRPDEKSYIVGAPER